MTPPASRYLPYLPYVVPSILAAVYVLRRLSPVVALSRLPGPVDPGLASLPSDSRVRQVYPEDWTSGGAYVTLPMGRVRYWVVGPESGKKITLIHGLTTPAIVFSRLVPILVAAGYRVLLYDLYGRGYSDAPRAGAYDTALYVMQLALLLQHVRWEKTHVVGFSMGGAIAAAFVATFPALVERDVVLIASAGAREEPIPLTRFRHLPLMESVTMRQVLRAHASVRSESEAQTPAQEIVLLQATHLRGYRRAVMSSLHDGPIVNMRWAFESAAWQALRVLFIHVCPVLLLFCLLSLTRRTSKGMHDPVVPPANSPRLRAMLAAALRRGLPPGSEYVGPNTLAEVVEVQDARHDVPWTHADEVGHAMLRFLEAKD
ncbi:Alpha/Beta hydrolase protein [Mycena pura]|uniref:Alpha/Beta hydrolase protein n=1 Tax=Mycena pura TaxID=153505 RepID=A0AAD6UQ07_9AGAR|nr:Alpha/Beta hydrolase protein [Mycena pura]